MNILYELDNRKNVNILIPEGKTMLLEGVQVPAPNWACSIPLDNTQALLEHLTQEQINSLGEQ